MKVTVLNENTVYRQGLLAEHGLSVLIETDRYRYLFDTGQSDVFLKNARAMGVTLEGLDGVILSHGHYDHTGGLPYLLDEGVPVYVGEGAFLPKIHKKQNVHRQIGIPWGRERLAPGQLHLIKDKTKIAEAVFLLPKVPYQVDFEPPDDSFFLEEKTEEGLCCRPDLMEDEQILVIRTDKGLSLFMGCCHMGIINCIRYVQEQFAGEHIYSILAGMHLMGAAEARVDRTLEALKELEVDVLLPVHCTGLSNIARMRWEMPEKCRLAVCGSVVTL